MELKLAGVRMEGPLFEFAVDRWAEKVTAGLAPFQTASVELLNEAIEVCIVLLRSWYSAGMVCAWAAVLTSPEESAAKIVLNITFFMMYPFCSRGAQSILFDSTVPEY
jgi:hypothetical protein